MSDKPLVKAEALLAEQYRQRADLSKDPTDLEWFTLHHAFCFLSYRMGELQAYLNEAVKPGEHPDA